ncbi:sensor domain-containing diguanylate cyclase [Planctomicrobium piriforme]|uniref:diguanylate cyclase n=1 Tax=Planctomicrobium piriforme TaxID=1576369 RepID=A0A1I3FWK4_9PLAN|nr:sensor domain-containing diguanylate cyclase [Planctomicrobium piriforme]SFI15606.1 PAS domain S-box-containing protein/diguanylate cyclase (GGDEF) domain-containing protein [Planctomicrobium piriforme]
MNSHTTKPGTQQLLFGSVVALFFVSYLAAAELGKLLSFPNQLATLWPPSGIYLAALLMAPRRTWPVFMAAAWGAALIFNVLWHEKSILLHTCFWFANTLEAVLGAAYLRRLAGPQQQFTLSRLPNVLGFACAGAIVPSALGACIATAGMHAAYETPFWSVWRVWWTAGGLGNLIVAPIFLSLADPLLRLPRRKWDVAEAFIAGAALIGLASWSLRVSGLTTAYAVFPVLLWIALRFELRGIAIANFLLAVITLWQSARLGLPFSSNESLGDRVLMIQTFLGVTAITSLTIAATLAERRRAWDDSQASEVRYRHLFENMSDLMIVLGTDGRIQYANNAWKSALGYDNQDLVTLALKDFVSPDDRLACEQLLQGFLSGKTTDRIELRWLTRAGQTIYVEGTCDLRTENGLPKQIYSILRDVTERKVSEQQNADYQRQLESTNAKLRSLSITDALTHLYNRRFFQQKLEEEFDRVRRYGSPLSLLLLDVDHFKSFNDTFGHLAGDRVLCRVGELLMETVRANDIVARYGGEEFAALLPMTDLESACRLAERIRRAIEAGPWYGKPITVSIGVASVTNDQTNALELIHLADEALYSSKQTGRNRVTGMDSRRQTILALDWATHVENLSTTR